MMDREFSLCPQCNYSAPPDKIRTERKHFDAHSLRCSRCLYQTETKETWLEAARFWNKARDRATTLALSSHHSNCNQGE